MQSAAEMKAPMGPVADLLDSFGSWFDSKIEVDSGKQSFQSVIFRLAHAGLSGIDCDLCRPSASAALRGGSSPVACTHPGVEAKVLFIFLMGALPMC